MTQWTDDELEQLLAETFASRESLADPAAAREIAAGVGTRRHQRPKWPAVFAAAAGVCAVVTATSVVLTGHGDVAPRAAGTSHPKPTAPTSPRSYVANRAAAALESARVVRLAPLPDGATSLPSRPAGWPPNTGIGLGPSDRSLTRTAWWAVPEDAGTLQRYLLSHQPPGMSREEGIEGTNAGVKAITYEEPSPKPDAFVGVSLIVEWRQFDGRSLVRADTFTAARAVRSRQSFVTGTASSIDLRRVVAGYPGGPSGGPVAPVTLRQPGDRREIAALVNAANDLHASIKPASVASCPFPGDPQGSVTIIFHTSTGTVRMHLDEGCGGQIEVWRDGRLLSPTLEWGRLITMATRLTPAH